MLIVTIIVIGTVVAWDSYFTYKLNLAKIQQDKVNVND